MKDKRIQAIYNDTECIPPYLKLDKRKPHTWGSIFRNALRRGEDHGYAAHLAEAWEKRQAKKQKK